MKNPVNYFRQLLSVRLSLWIVLFAAIIFIGALSYMFQESRRAVREEAISHATQILDNTVQRVDGIIDEVEVATRNMVWLPEQHIDNPEVMSSYTKNIVENNPDLYGCSLSFAPNFYRSKGLYYSIYSFREDGQVKTVREGDEDYQYFCMDWYLLPMLLDKPCWTEPYIDAGSDTLYSKEFIVSYGIPIKDKEQKFAGVISADISLSWLSQVISAVKPYPNSYSIMIGQGGSYLVHPDSTKLFYETIFTETLETPDTAVTALGHAMQAMEEGMKQMTINGEDCYVFYKPLEKIGWSVAIICPESDIFRGFNRLRHAVLIIVLIGLLLMLFIVSQIITKELKPLRLLDDQAQIIASGQFDQSLSASGRVDEIGRLAHSFGDMQQSLITYMNELKEATAQKERFESELRIASDIQMTMVPSTFPENCGFDLYATMTPAKMVGGDLYNYLVLEDKLYLALGDVSGKGVPASLFMTQATRLFRTLAGEGLSPEAIAERMNSGLCEGNESMMFVTMFIGLVNLRTGQLNYCNCGHNPPTIDGKFIELQFTNRPLGMFEGGEFEGETIADIRGKQILIYTDGLNEAMNTESVQFGNERLLKMMSESKNLTSREVVENVRAAVEAHRNGAEPSDDLTLMCFRFEKLCDQ
jgi:sigma-B regulation protein RsbU (phosphoserine phosphatase)